jgi:hypothetical protein
LKKHLGIWYEWKNDKVTKELYLEASMPNFMEEIIINNKKKTGKEAKFSSVPATPGKCLSKHEGQPVMLDEYKQAWRTTSDAR